MKATHAPEVASGAGFVGYTWVHSAGQKESLDLFQWPLWRGELQGIPVHLSAGDVLQLMLAAVTLTSGLWAIRRLWRTRRQGKGVELK